MTYFKSVEEIRSTGDIKFHGSTVVRIRCCNRRVLTSELSLYLFDGLVLQKILI